MGSLRPSHIGHLLRIGALLCVRGLLWLRDLMLLARVDAAAGLVFEERRDELLTQLARFPQADWGMATGFVEDALSMLERNINPTLVFTNMFLDIRQAMRGREPAGAGVLVQVGHTV